MQRRITKHNIILPFVYYFFLAFGLLYLSTTWITKGTKETQISYAQDNLDSGMKITLTKKKKIILKERAQLANDTIAQKIDKFFEKRKAPLVGYGSVFTQEARNNEIDPTIVAAIAWCESNGGKITPQFGGKDSYNAWGYAVFDNNNITKTVNGYDMGSWKNGIAVMSRAIRKNYDRKLISVEQIVTRYTPASVRKANGDPTKAPWTLCVKGTMKKIRDTSI